MKSVSMFSQVYVLPTLFGGMIGSFLGSAIVTTAWCFDELEHPKETPVRWRRGKDMEIMVFDVNKKERILA